MYDINKDNNYIRREKYLKLHNIIINMAIVIHTIKGHQYAYEHHRVGDKIICDYIGAVGDQGQIIKPHSLNKQKVTQHDKLYDKNNVNLEKYIKLSKMDRSDFGTKDFKYSPNLESEAETKGDTIYVGDKFFKLNPEDKKHVLIHESGHKFESKFMKGKEYWKVSDSKVFNKSAGEGYYSGILGTYNAHETIAESYANYVNPNTHDKFIKNYPDAAKYIETKIIETGYYKDIRK